MFVSNAVSIVACICIGIYKSDNAARSFLQFDCSQVRIYHLFTCAEGNSEFCGPESRVKQQARKATKLTISRASNK